ncbi:6-hydroxymethylpterin diphosphokinase MptE-like protein [Devosia alba]|uniref:6-hydroxymethylpterin diphosphokinase MptE-like protein n=1 Tax=Devosia alba TaxID=3152360 RepID=UPI00326521CA
MVSIDQTVTTAFSSSEPSMQNLAELAGRYQGRQCFILGNGPSLNKTRLDNLKNEFTIGLNRIYLKFPDMGYATSAICCVNDHVLRQFGKEIVQQPGLKLLSSKAAASIEPDSSTVFMQSAAGIGFNTDLSNHTWYTGATVTYCALQFAYHLGFSEVVLLGVDHNFASSGRPHLESAAKGPDINHFDPSYFGKNVIWQFPDLVESELNFAVAREVFRVGGRNIYDGTVGGKLMVFPKIGGFSTEASEPPLTPTESEAMDIPIVVGKRPLAEFLLNGRLRKFLVPFGVAAFAIGSFWLLLQIVSDDRLLPLLLALFLMFGGLSVVAVNVALDKVTEMTRQRRLKDGQTLIQILKLIR